MIRGNYEITDGIIIGGDYVVGQLYFDGRPQGGKMYAPSEEELMECARHCKASLMQEFAGSPCYLYQGDKWELRIYP